MYNPNVPSSNMGIAPISGQPSQPLGPTPMVGPAPMGPMGPPPPMAPPMMGGMPPPPMMAPPPMAPPIAPITEGLGGFGGSSAGRAGFSERMQRMTSPPKPKPMPQPMPVQRMNMGGAVSSQGLSMYQPPMMPRPMGMMGGVPNRVEPLKMALGGFIGNPTTRDYSDDDPFGTDDLLDSLGIPDFDPNKDFGGGGDDSGGDDDDYYNYLDDDYVYVPPPAPAPPVVVPEPESGGDGDIQDRVIADLVYGPADPTVGPNNAQEALDQASADFKAGRGDVADMDLATLANRISRGRDVMPARLSNVDAISRDFAVPVPEDTTFSDPDEIFNLRNPISLNAAQVVGPNYRTDASGNLIPGRADTKADIEAGTEAARFEPAPPEVMSFDPSIGGSGSNLIGLGPSASELGFDDSIKSPVPVTTTLADAATFTPTLGGGFGELGGRGQLSVDEDVFSTKDMVLPGDIPTQSTQSFNIPNRVDAGRAALDLLRAKEKRGITSLSNMAEKNEELRKELEILQGRAGERFANNIDEATSFYKPEGTGMDALNQMLSDPANYEINRVGRLSPEELAQSPFGETEAKYVVPPIGAPITDAELSEARKIYGDFDPTLGAPYVAPSSDIEFEVAQPTGGGLMSGTPGMQSYLEDYPAGTGGTEFVAPIGTRRNSDGRTVSGIAPSPAPAVIRPQNTKYLSPFDISELENLEEDYYKTGAGSKGYSDISGSTYATAEALKRAEGDVSALDRIAEARMPTDDMQIVDDMRSVPRSSLEFAAPVGDLAQFEPQVRATSSQPASADPDGSGTEVDDVDIFGGNFNRNQFTDREFYKNREDLYSLFGPSKGAEIFNSAVKSLSMGLIDLDKLSAKQREKALEAYLETGKLAYNKDGKLIGVEDPDGRAILLGPQPPKDEDNIGGDDDGCPPGFRKVNGVCMPIRQNRVAANPATAISDSINKATLPSTLRPIVRDVVDDDDEEEETSDVGGLTIRRPNYFAGGGAVSEGMGSAIDSFLSSMGGSVKKKSNVAPVGMANGGYVSARTPSGEVVGNLKTRVDRNSRGPASAAYYGSSYEGDDVFGLAGGSDDNEYNFHTTDAEAAPVYPIAMSTSGSDDSLAPVGLTRSLRPQLRPASFDPYVNNAISSVQDNYNDGSVGPTIQNAAALPKQETFMQGISNYLPESVNSAFMLGPNYDQSVFGAAADMGTDLATSFYDDVIGPEGKPLEYLGGAAVDLGQSVFDTLYDPPKAVYGAVDSVFDAFGRLGTETNARDRVGNIIGGPLAAATAVTPLGRLGKLTPKNNTISTDIKPTFKDLNLAHGTPRTDPFKPEIQVQMADGTTQFMDMFSPDGLIETKFTSGFPEGAKVIGDYPFGRFSTDFIGAGEGRMIPGSLLARKSSKGAAHGKGVYLAENPELSTDVYRFIGQNQYKPDGLPKNFSLDAALRQKQGIINKYGSPEEALEAFESGKVISKPDYNSVSQAYFQGAENALNSDNPILSKISSDLMGGMEPSYRAKLEQLKIEKPEEWQTIISNHINERINSIRTKSREDQLAKGQKIVDDPDIQRASNILNKNAMDTRNRVYDEKASYDAMLQIMQSGVLPYNTPNIPGSTKRATINESKLGKSLDLDSPSAVGDTRIGFDKNVRQDMLDIFGEEWVADRESGMFADPNNPGNLLRGAPNQTDYRTEGAYAPRTVEEMNKLADAGYSHLSFYDGKSREVHRRATKRMQDIQKQLEGTTLERYLSYANKNNPQDVAKMTKLYEVEVANLENEMKKARESLTGLTKNYVFFDDKTMPKITESYAKGGQVGMGLGSL
jgi:hypothetical protein